MRRRATKRGQSGRTEKWTSRNSDAQFSLKECVQIKVEEECRCRIAANWRAERILFGQKSGSSLLQSKHGVPACLSRRGGRSSFFTCPDIKSQPSEVSERAPTDDVVEETILAEVGPRG